MGMKVAGLVGWRSGYRVELMTQRPEDRNLSLLLFSSISNHIFNKYPAQTEQTHQIGGKTARHDGHSSLTSIQLSKHSR